MRKRRNWQALCVGLSGVALALVPVTVASAHNNHKSNHHSSGHVKGSNPNAAMCGDVKKEQTSSSGVATEIEKALESNNFAAAKQAMLNAYTNDERDVQKALGVIRSAPANVQAAFKNLLSYEQKLKGDIESATSLQGMVASFESQGTSTQLAADGATISNWYTSVCGGTLVTTTTASIP